MNNNNLPKKINIFDKIRNKIKYLLGYRDAGRFMIDTEPKKMKITNITQSRLANIEEELKKVLYVNSKQEIPLEGIEEKDAIKLLEWTVHNAREGLARSNKIRDISEQDLMGMYGLVQGIIAITLQNMGLSPNVLNISEIVGKQAGRHAFVTVNIPIKLDDGNVVTKTYLIDTTFRHFYLISEFTNQYGDFIADKRFGGKVPSMPGYWMLKQGKRGEELSEEILSKGFFELTEEKAKIYFDSVYLPSVKRNKPTKVPKKSELRTEVEGSEYIRRTQDKNNKEEIDYTESELNSYGVNTKTLLMVKREQRNTTPVVEQNDQSNRQVNTDKTPEM